MKNNISYMIIGKTGAGKTTLSANLVNEYPLLRYINTGDLFRTLEDDGGDLVTRIKSKMSQGEPLIAEDALSVFKKNYDFHNKYEGFNLVIDGLPRNISQFDALSNFMKNNYRDYVAILLESSDDTIKSRIQNVNRFRSDDNPETVQKKLKAYEDQTLPLIDLLKKNNKLITINSDQDEMGVIKSIKIELFKVF